MKNLSVEQSLGFGFILMNLQQILWFFTYLKMLIHILLIMYIIIVYNILKFNKNITQSSTEFASYYI